MGLAEVLLLFEVHLKRTLDGHKRDAALQEENTVQIHHVNCIGRRKDET